MKTGATTLPYWLLVTYCHAFQAIELQIFLLLWMTPSSSAAHPQLQRILKATYRPMREIDNDLQITPLAYVLGEGAHEAADGRTTGSWD